MLKQYEYLGVDVPKDVTPYKIEPYIPDYNRQPNPDFKYDENKINQIINNVDPVYINSDNVPTFKNKKKLREWAKVQFLENRHVTIVSDKEQILLSVKNMRRATEKQKPDDIKINAVFSKIREVLQNAQYYDFEPLDDKHKNKDILGQYVYYSKIIIDKTPYLVRFKIDVPTHTYGELQYAGHRIIKM